MAWKAKKVLLNIDFILSKDQREGTRDFQVGISDLTDHLYA